METWGSVWQIGAIALVAGVLIGALAYRLYAASTSKTDQIKSELDQTRDEMAQYRASVQSHFDRTSELVNELTHNYAKVYQHLAEGAHALGDSKTMSNLLEQQAGRVVIAVDETIVETARSDTDSPPEAAQAPLDVSLSDEIDFVVGEADAAAGDGAGAAADLRTDPGVGDTGRVSWEPVTPAAGVEPAIAQESDSGEVPASAEPDEGGQKQRKSETEPA